MEGIQLCLPSMDMDSLSSYTITLSSPSAVAQAATGLLVTGEDKPSWVKQERTRGFSGIKEDVDEIILTEGEEETEPVDNATLVETNNSLQLRYYDFHMVYSDSYRVPVLYFRCYYIDGQPLALDEIEKDLPACAAKVLLESKWTFITPEEHSYLNRPWYKLHPCGTGEWMKLLFLGDDSVAKNGVAVEQYLVSWLSVVGQVVGIRIPFEMLTDPKSCN